MEHWNWNLQAILEQEARQRKFVVGRFSEGPIYLAAPGSTAAKLLEERIAKDPTWVKIDLAKIFKEKNYGKET